MLPGRETTNISGNRFLFLSALSVPTAVLKLRLGREQTMCWGPARVSSVLGRQTAATVCSDGYDGKYRGARAVRKLLLDKVACKRRCEGTGHCVFGCKGRRKHIQFAKPKGV